MDDIDLESLETIKWNDPHSLMSTWTTNTSPSTMEQRDGLDGLGWGYTQPMYRGNQQIRREPGRSLEVPQVTMPDQHNITQTGPFDALLQHVDIGRYRDSVCQYLKVPSDLWSALFYPRVLSSAQKILSHHLMQVYGPLPAGLWQYVVALRSDPHFDYFQEELAGMVTSIPVSQLHSRTGSSASLFDQSSPENIRSVGTFQPSPVQSPGDTTPWPVLDVAIQAQPSTTGPPISTMRGRTNSRNPYSKEKGKGRAPDGQRYCCPEPGCTHSPFKNAGNYLIHMWRWHPEYPQRDPAFALRCIPSNEVDETIPNDNSAILDDICEPSVAPDQGLSFGLFQETLQRPGCRYPPKS
jgi:hypothetical protein